MKLVQLFILFISVMVFSACTPKTNDASQAVDNPDLEITAQEKMWDKVMVIHDDVMPKMSELNKIKKQLEEKSKVIRNEILQPKIIAAIKTLEQADEGMWDWMHGLKQLKALRKEKTHDEIMLYLSEQLAAIRNVKAAMETSMENGKNLLKQ